MKKLLALASLALALTSCVSVSGTRNADGSITIASHRLFWASEGIDFQTTVATNGVLAASLKVAKSSTDATSIGAVFTGLQALGVSAAK
jgi:heat shock protein HslJ